MSEHEDLCKPAEDLYKDYPGKFGNIFSIKAGPDYEEKIREIDGRTLQEVRKYISGEIEFLDTE